MSSNFNDFIALLYFEVQSNGEYKLDEYPNQSSYQFRGWNEADWSKVGSTERPEFRRIIVFNCFWSVLSAKNIKKQVLLEYLHEGEKTVLFYYNYLTLRD